MNSNFNENYYNLHNEQQNSGNDSSTDFWDDIGQNDDFQVNLFGKIPKNENETRKEDLYERYKDLIEKFDIPSRTEKLKTEVGEDQNHRCNLLYEHAKVRLRCLSQIRKENENRKKDSELSECTFTPKISKSPYKNRDNDSSLYDRNKKWLVSKQESLVKARRRHSDDIRNAYNYSPIVNTFNENDISRIFNQEKNIINQPENYNYLVRQYRARNNQNANKKHKKSKDNNIYLTTSHYSHNSQRKVSKSYLSQFKTHIHNEILNM